MNFALDFIFVKKTQDCRTFKKLENNNGIIFIVNVMGSLKISNKSFLFRVQKAAILF